MTMEDWIKRATDRDGRCLWRSWTKYVHLGVWWGLASLVLPVRGVMVPSSCERGPDSRPQDVQHLWPHHHRVGRLSQFEEKYCILCVFFVPSSGITMTGRTRAQPISFALFICNTKYWLDFSFHFPPPLSNVFYVGACLAWSTRVSSEFQFNWKSWWLGWVKP